MPPLGMGSSGPSTMPPRASLMQPQASNASGNLPQNWQNGGPQQQQPGQQQNNLNHPGMQPMQGTLQPGMQGGPMQGGMQGPGGMQQHTLQPGIQASISAGLQIPMTQGGIATGMQMQGSLHGGFRAGGGLQPGMQQGPMGPQGMQFQQQDGLQGLRNFNLQHQARMNNVRNISYGGGMHQGMSPGMGLQPSQGLGGGQPGHLGMHHFQHGMQGTHHNNSILDAALRLGQVLQQNGQATPAAPPAPPPPPPDPEFIKRLNILKIKYGQADFAIASGAEKWSPEELEVWFVTQHANAGNSQKAAEPSAPLPVPGQPTPGVALPQVPQEQKDRNAPPPQQRASKSPPAKRRKREAEDDYEKQEVDEDGVVQFSIKDALKLISQLSAYFSAQAYQLQLKELQQRFPNRKSQGHMHKTQFFDAFEEIVLAGYGGVLPQWDLKADWGGVRMLTQKMTVVMKHPKVRKSQEHLNTSIGLPRDAVLRAPSKKEEEIFVYRPDRDGNVPEPFAPLHEDEDGGLAHEFLVEDPRTGELLRAAVSVLCDCWYEVLTKPALIRAKADTISAMVGRKKAGKRVRVQRILDEKWLQLHAEELEALNTPGSASVSEAWMLLDGAEMGTPGKLLQRIIG